MAFLRYDGDMTGSETVFAALRVYALLNSKVLPAVVVLLLNLVPFATNIVSAPSTVQINTDTELHSTISQRAKW